MKQMNKNYEAPKTEVVELNVNCAFMQSGSTTAYTEEGE